MSTIAEARGLTKKYRDTVALNDVNFTIESGKIYGLLGRNGAGKTTIMSILAAQAFETSGTVRVFGEHPYENDRVLERICFIREAQKYPDDFKPKHAFKAAAMFYRNWDQHLCDQLVADFQLPVSRRIKKLSRGQLSAVGVIIGLASRAELTFFDEPYLGLDAVARQIFYDRLLADYAEFPRTIVLSSHLIDEVANLLEHVLVVDQGEIMMDDDAEHIKEGAATIVGPASKVEPFVRGLHVVHRDGFGALASVTVSDALTDEQHQEASSLGLELAPVSLQQLIVRTTMRGSDSPGSGDLDAELKDMENSR